MGSSTHTEGGLVGFCAVGGVRVVLGENRVEGERVLRVREEKGFIPE